ncbi:hypothetical protein SLA2020_049910 [Shorea laevis]
MGITGELVRSVFSRNKSGNGRTNVVEKRRRGTVRSYLCGEEFYSVMAEEDSASVKSSEATVTQPLSEPLMEKGDIQSEASQQNIPRGKQDSISDLYHEEDAAIVIQSAFTRFLTKCRNIEEIKSKDGNKEPFVEGTGIRSRESLGTSIEVQTGNSVEVFSAQEESIAVKHRLQTKPRTQISKIKEDWDDSTVSSNVSQMRIQNRLEAMTRRERALAYAFAQQLRICSKRKQSRADDEHNMSWSWLERWMATRIPESIVVENSNQRVVVQKRLTDFVGEEKESCGSNEVPVHQFDCLSVSESSEKDGHRSSMNSLKTAKNISRMKTVPSYQLPQSVPRGARTILQEKAERVKIIPTDHLEGRN